MATLDNAVWLTGAGGTAVGGTTTITDGPYSTDVTASFTGSWDASQGGNNVSEFGAFAVTSPITADYDFSTPVENLSFTIDHVNDDGASTYDDYWTIEAYDADGNLVPAADVIASLSGVDDELVIENPDGTVSIQTEGTNANDIDVNLSGPISSLVLTYEPGPDAPQTGGSGISDLTFDVPAPDTDGDGVGDDVDLDIDGDGILNEDEMGTGPFSATSDQVDINTTGGSSTNTIDLSAYGVSIGDTVDISNILADGDLNGSSETFTLDFNNGEYNTGNLQTGIQNNGSLTSVTSPQTFTVTVVDIGGGVPGLVVTGDASGDVNPLNGEPALSYTFDIAGTGAVAIDSDGDGIADHLDLDSDNDGITDNVEAQSSDGYVAPTGNDADGDGVDDAYDATPTTGAAGSNGLTPEDTDNDGTADYLDTDSDNDGTSDTDEAGHGVDQATIDASGDSDGDGIKDVVDDVAGWDVNDADVDVSGNLTLADTDGDAGTGGDYDFRDDTVDITDTDGDGVPDSTDIDIDGDGILNEDEMDTSSFSATSDQVDINTTGGSSTNTIDLSAYGVSIGDTVDISNILADGDLNGSSETFTLDFNNGEYNTGDLQTGIQNNGSLTSVTSPQTFTVEVVDIGGGVPGLIVTGDASGTVNPLNGEPALSYTFDISGTVSVPVDTDGDGIADHLDLDSDNDGITDNVEAQSSAGYVAPTGNDADGDGLDDAYDATPTTGAAGSNGLTAEDTDGDGVLDFLDLDSDNDGITDNVEAQSTAGYVAPTGNDADGDGIDDAYDSTPTTGHVGSSGLTPEDTDLDGTGDYRDTDSDNDGLTDAEEAGHGILQSVIDASGDADGDGIKDVVDDVSGWDVNDTDVDISGVFIMPDTDGDLGSGGDLDYRDVICFTTGSLILTDRGERPIEDLRVGDMVVTRDNGPQPIRWISHTTTAGVGRLAPVRIQEGAFGNHSPLIVSPQHRMVYEGPQASLLFAEPEVMIPAVHLLHSGCATQTDVDSVTYYHIMFDTHQVIFANGAATESFHPGHQGLKAVDEAARDELFTLFPELRSEPRQYGDTARMVLKKYEARVLDLTR